MFWYEVGERTESLACVGVEEEGGVQGEEILNSKF